MSLQKASSALSFLPADDRDFWVKIGMAIKSEFGDDGCEIWLNWSQSAESFNERAAKAVWRSINTIGKIRIGTLFHEAASRGWRDGEQRGALTGQELHEKRLRQQRYADSLSIEEKRKELGHRNAADLSQKLIDACERKTHYYLNSKGLPDAIGLVADGVLIVPMRNLKTNAVQGAQTIEWIPIGSRWEKKMLPGMRAKGAVLRLGNKHAPETFLCEGYATGLSIEMALNRMRLNASVMVCFSDSNLSHVSTMLSGKVFVCADNDVSNAGEKAAVKTGYPYLMAPTVGDDFNDHHQRVGIMGLCSLIMQLRKIV